MEIAQSPLNPLRFVIRLNLTGAGHEDFLGACEGGNLGPVDAPWLAEDEWRMGKYIRAVQDASPIQWLRDRSIPHQFARAECVAEYPLVLQLFDLNEASRVLQSL